MSQGIWAVVVAAGNGVRLGSETPKVLYPLAGRPLLEWTLAPFAASCRVEGICVVKTPALTETVKSLLGNTGKPWVAVDGGQDRGGSVLQGLRALPESCRWAMVHDGARPCLTEGDVEALIDCLLEHGTAVAGYPARDTLHRVDAEGTVRETPDRAQLWAVQTPQCFGREALTKAYERAQTQGLSFTDDAAVYRWNGGKVCLRQTRTDNLKLTTREELPLLEAVLRKRKGQSMRIGTGYDVHRLAAGRRLVIGGVEIPHEWGLDGHSDADVLTHAVMDALLGAAGLGDIGQMFPPDDPAYLDADSLVLLAEVALRVRQAGWTIGNVDAVVIAQRPKLMPYREAMINGLARAMGIAPDCVSVKATTTEGLGFEGRQEGISAQATALLTLTGV